MIIITIANKWDMWYNFYNGHNMHAVEWKLIAKFRKNKNLINKLKRRWRHPLIREFESYRI